MVFGCHIEGHSYATAHGTASKCESTLTALADVIMQLPLALNMPVAILFLKK